MLFSADDADNKDNSLETDPFACWQPGDTCYEWQANGMLAGVRTPDGRTVTFGYDALGRRVSKRTGDTVHRFGWDGNVVLHEWDTDEALGPRLVTDETGRKEYDGTALTDNGWQDTAPVGLQGTDAVASVTVSGNGFSQTKVVS